LAIEQWALSPNKAGSQPESLTKIAPKPRTRLVIIYLE